MIFGTLQDFQGYANKKSRPKAAQKAACPSFNETLILTGLDFWLTGAGGRFSSRLARRGESPPEGGRMADQAGEFRARQ
ncbi:MAG: hypothetical protein DRQ02_09520 [Candidatus Latescibacterota bacterium]|nr:MAG: hypothetical protein DRQ02_09520 [Candidatus Latescibacterota bacterium]RKY73288.1 MAG: hypothetical protein DRQ24_02580 [Candidatus Latescibacterota bacterium]